VAQGQGTLSVVISRATPLASVDGESLGAMREQFSDPAKVEAMCKQAFAMQAAMQAQRPSSERARQDAGALQKELGLT